MGGATVGLLLAVVVFAPARWLATAVHQASAERVSLSETRGSIWDGSSRMVLTGGAGSGAGVALPGRVHWRIRPVWPGLSIAIQAECCMQQAVQLRATASGLGRAHLLLADSQSQWPAGLLSGLGTPWNTIQLQGQLEARTQGLELDWAHGQLSLSGQLQLDALGVTSRLSTLSPMGSYRIQLQGGPAPSLQLSTLDGSLQLSGRGEWLGQRLRFNGVASAAPERVEALSNLLNIVGRRDGARSIITVG
jgi:general secretion pathway protein N